MKETIIAQSLDFTSGESFGLQAIKLPVFLDLESIKNFSIISYFSFGLSLIFFGILMLWAAIVVRAAIDYIRSEGDAGKISDAIKKYQNVLWSVTLLFGFVVGLSLVASFFGLGGFWTWPKAFSVCANGEYYYRFMIKKRADLEAADPDLTLDTINQVAEQLCLAGDDLYPAR